jgi:hypothetical protein
MYTSYRSCLITVLKLPTHVFEEAILKTSKLHNLFIYSFHPKLLECFKKSQCPKLGDWFSN